MVKIVDVGEEPDVSRDEDDCVEIDPAEFAKKLNLKETDDVILVAAKGKVSPFSNPFLIFFSINLPVG